MSDDDIMYISMFSTVAPAILSLIFFREIPLPLKILGMFILTQFGLEIVVHYMYLSDVNNMIVFRIYTYLGFSAISIIYYLIFKSSLLKRVVLICLAGFYLISIFGLNIDVKAFNPYQNVIKSGVILLYCVLYVHEFFKTRKSFVFKLHPYFVLTFGFVIYFTGMINVFLFGEDFLIEQNLSGWVIHCVLNTFLNAVYCYCYVLWKMNKQEIY